MLNPGKVFSLCIAVLVVSIGAVDPRLDSEIYRNVHGLYRVPLGHERPAVRAVKEGRVWEKKTLAYIKACYEEGTSIVHGGTYFGDMLPFYSKLVGESGKVIAFEPSSTNYFCAQHNIELNHLRNVELHHMALGDVEQMVWLETAKGDELLGGASKVCQPGENRVRGSSYEEVAFRRLDDVVGESPNRIGIIQLDVEGCEAMALRGAMETIARHRPVLILEVWSGKGRELSTLLASMGYKKEVQVDQNWVFVPR